MKAIQEFQTNPKAAMAKYGNNKEVMEGLMEFSMMMGNQFQNLSQKQKKWLIMLVIFLVYKIILLRNEEQTFAKNFGVFWSGGKWTELDTALTNETWRYCANATW